MEKKSNGKVIFITALISVLSTLVLVVGILFVIGTVSSVRTGSSVNSARIGSSVNSLDGYYENNSFLGRTNIEIKGNEAVIMWKGYEYVGELDPKTKTIEFDDKKLKYQVKLGRLVIENDDKKSDIKDVIFKKRDKEEAERERKKQEEKAEKEEEEEEKSSSSSSDDD